MGTQRDLLREAMLRTSTTQTALARTSGVHQPSISQFLSGRIDLSDDQLDRLLSCLGYRLEVVRRMVEPDLTRSERRSWMLHRRLAGYLDGETLPTWRARLLENLDRLRAGVQGPVHVRNVDRWSELVTHDDLGGLRRALTGLDRSSIEMREVSPFSGLLPDEERLAVLRELRATG